MDAGFAGGENLARLKSALRRDAEAMSALSAMGLNAATRDRLHLGLKAPYRARSDGLEIRRALCFPLLGEGCRALSRYAYLNLPAVTENAPSLSAWGPGSSQCYRLGSHSADAEALVSADVVDCWLSWQMLAGRRPNAAFLSRSHADDWPAEWHSPAFWSGFAKVILVPGAGSADFLQMIARGIGRAVHRAVLPCPYETLRQLSASRDWSDFGDVLDAAEPIQFDDPRVDIPIQSDRLGRFAAAAVRISGAHVGGFSYYPFLTETREAEQQGGGAARVVQSYATMVLRSDGRLLAPERLPSPRGTPNDRRVLALSDGTRIVDEPLATLGGTWSFHSIQRFVDWRCSGGPQPFRPFGELLDDIERVLRTRVWLPFEGSYLIATMYVALSYVFEVFDAIPLLLLCGRRGSGKSELGETIARLSFNASLAGQLRPAGMIRMLDETRGLLVVDDMDGRGQASLSGNGELAQALKVSYKRSTARKPIADRAGRVRMVDFYGPKVAGNTMGVDQVLASRMLGIPTKSAPLDAPFSRTPWSDVAMDALRDELHCWGMSSAGEISAIYRAMSPPADRRTEIEMPLVVLASFVAGKTISARLRCALDDVRTRPRTF